LAVRWQYELCCVWHIADIKRLSRARKRLVGGEGYSIDASLIRKNTDPFTYDANYLIDGKRSVSGTEHPLIRAMLGV